MRTRLRSRMLLALLATICAALAGEATLRLVWRGEQRYSIAATSDQYRFYQFDPVLGWANTPWAKGTFQRDEFTYAVAINEHGMRQAPVAKAKAEGLRRIAVMGDSFVWGIGVADQDRVTEQLAGMLRGVEVLNFGVSGYGPVQHLLRLDEVLAFAPDLVVVMFCLGNDFADDVLLQRYGYYKPYAALGADGALVVAGYPLPDTRSFGFAQRHRLLGSELLGATMAWLRPRARDQEGLLGFTEATIYLDPATATAAERGLQDRAVAIEKAVLTRLAERLRAAGVRLLLVPAPTKRDYEAAAGVPPRAEQVLQDIADAAGIDIVPTVPRLGLDDFWVHDGHWTPQGHRKLAAVIAAGLISEGWTGR